MDLREPPVLHTKKPVRLRIRIRSTSLPRAPLTRAAPRTPIKSNLLRHRRSAASASRISEGIMSATRSEQQPDKTGRLNLRAEDAYERSVPALLRELGFPRAPDSIGSTSRAGRHCTPQSVEFANACEEEFARILEFHKVLWRYKPRTFAVEWDEEGKFMDSFTPGFYLPPQDRYVELASPDCHVSDTAKKVRLLRQQYSRVKIDLIV